MAHVSNGKELFMQKSAGAIKDLDDGKCLNWQIFLKTKVTRDNKNLNNGKHLKWQGAQATVYLGNKRVK